jgi:hypothetical protein
MVGRFVQHQEVRRIVQHDRHYQPRLLPAGQFPAALFRVFIDPLGSQKYAAVPGDCTLDVMPGPPIAMRLVTPRLTAPGPVPVLLPLGGARIKDRYRGAYSNGAVTVTGASIRHVRGFGFDHPEQSYWRDGATSVALRTVTHGDNDSIELTLSHSAHDRQNSRIPFNYILEGWQCRVVVIDFHSYLLAG